MPFPSPGESSLPGIEPTSLMSPALAGGSFITCEIPAPPRHSVGWVLTLVQGRRWGWALFLACGPLTVACSVRRKWPFLLNGLCPVATLGPPGLGPVHALGRALLTNVASGPVRRTSQEPFRFSLPSFLLFLSCILLNFV